MLNIVIFTTCTTILATCRTSSILKNSKKIFSSRFKLEWTYLALFFFVGCSATTIELPKNGVTTLPQMSVVAYLPSQSKDETPRENLQFLHNQVESELKNRGYLVLDATVTKQNCPKLPCPLLFLNHHVDTIAKLELEKVRRINAFLGFFNEIAGSLSLYGKNGEQLAKIKDTQRERGGLLFNTGQVFKGISATFANREKSKFELLAAKMARNLVFPLPAPQLISSPTQTKEEALIITSSNVIQLSPEKLTVCVKATPSKLAFTVINSHNIKLREVLSSKLSSAKPLMSNYCANLAVNALRSTKPRGYVVVKNLYGQEAREELKLSPYQVCKPEEVASLQANATIPTIKIDKKVFSDPSYPCYGSTFQVFHTFHLYDAPQKVATIKDEPMWEATNKLTTGQWFIVAINKNGTQSNFVSLVAK
jgi:hypothetical protein